MTEPINIPTEKEIIDLAGEKVLSVWKKICSEIESAYDMERQWNSGGKRWTYEYKYRRGGKTLCALYLKKDGFGFMIIFGKDEREKIEAIRGTLSERTMKLYDEATTYHDGKWVMFDENIPICDILPLLAVKRKPNR